MKQFWKMYTEDVFWFVVFNVIFISMIRSLFRSFGWIGGSE